MGTLLQNMGGGHARPEFIAASCINKKQRKYTCTVCTDVCPQKVFSLSAQEKLRWDKCIGCGLCVSACPSRCIAASATMRRELTQDIDLGRPVSFSCYKEEKLCDKTVECLGSIPWELLAVLALQTDVVLQIHACGECEEEARCATLRSNLEQLLLFLGEDRFTQRVHLLQGEDFASAAVDPGEKTVDRREILSGAKKSLTKNLARAAARRLPFLEETDPDGLAWRRMLTNAAAKRRQEERQAGSEGENLLPDFGLQLPAFTRNCYGCGICEKLCPRQALVFGPLENGKRLISIEPGRCTGCGLCVRLCPWQGLKGMAEMRVPALTKLPYVRVESAACENCGAVIRPGTDPALCPTCERKKKQR